MLDFWRRLPEPLRHTLIYAAALGLSRGIGLATVPITTHFLSRSDFGRLDVILTLSDLLSIVIACGLGEALFRFGSRGQTGEERNRTVTVIFLLACGLALVWFLVLQASVDWLLHILPKGPSETELRVLLASLSISGSILVALAWLRFNGRPGLYLLASVGRTGGQAILAIALLMLGAGVMGVLAAGLAASLTLFGLLGSYLILRCGFSFQRSTALESLRYGAPLAFVGISGFLLGSFDRWILASYAGMEELADYALAAKFGVATVMLMQPFEMWWLPKRFQILASTGGEQAAARFGATGVTGAFLAAIFVAAIGPLALESLTPPAYHGASAYVPWLALLAALQSSATMLGLGCYSRKHTVIPAIIDAVAAAVAVAGYFLFIPTHGAWGAIFVTGIAFLLRLALLYGVGQKLLPLPYPALRLCGFASATAFLIGITSLTEGAGMKLAMGLTGFLALAALALGGRLIAFPALSKMAHA